MRSILDIARKITNFPANKITWERLLIEKNIYLYAGDLPKRNQYKKFIGLSLSQANKCHIKHDIREPYPLPNNCVDIYQAEDVFEHIEYEKLPSVIGEIYRVLKGGGILRISVPDYRCDILYNRTQKNEKDELLFDPDGGGDFIDGNVVNGGHVWFPRYETIKELLEKAQFKEIRFYHYYDEQGKGITKPIDYSIGYVMRTPDHDKRVANPYRPMSIVVDCIK